MGGEKSRSSTAALQHHDPPSPPPFPSFLLPPIIPAPPPSFLRRQEPTPAPTLHIPHPTPPPSPVPFPNSSLPPTRGEVRWRVGSLDRPPPLSNTSIAPPTPFPSFPHPLVIPAPPPSFLRRQESAHATALRVPRPTPSRTPSRTPAPSPIHPSPLPGGRLGGGWEASNIHRRSPTPRSPLPPRFRHPRTPSIIPTPPPSFLRRQEPAHATALRTPTAGRRWRGLGGPSGCGWDAQPPRFLPAQE